MKALLLALALLALPAESKTIREALEEGSRAYAAEVKSGNANRVARDTIATHARVQAAIGIDVPIYVSPIERGGATFMDAMIVDISLDIMSEVQRAFIIAHEFGHVKLGHINSRLELIQSLVPGQIEDEAVKAAYQWVLLRPEVRQQSYEFEHAADVFAGKVLLSLGYSKSDILLAVRGFRVTPNTPTHPSTTARYMRLLEAL